MVTATDSSDNGPENQNSVLVAVNKLATVMHSVKLSQGTQSMVLGQTPTSEVCLDGVPVKALLDTGLPISIISLEFFLQVCVQSCQPSNTPEEWGRAVKERIQKPAVTLRN